MLDKSSIFFLNCDNWQFLSFYYVSRLEILIHLLKIFQVKKCKIFK